MTVSEGGLDTGKQHTFLGSRPARADAVFGMAVTRSLSGQRAIALTQPAKARRGGYRFIGRCSSAGLGGWRRAGYSAASASVVGLPSHLGVCAPDAVTLQHPPATRCEKQRG